MRILSEKMRKKTSVGSIGENTSKGIWHQIVDQKINRKIAHEN